MLDNIALILGTTFMYATPLIYSALAGVVSEKSGVINLGLEGMMVIGAFIGATCGFYFGNPFLAFVCAGLVGGLMGLLHAVACVSFSANQVISGVALNFVGPGVSLFLSRMIFRGATTTPSIALAEKMPRILSGVFPEGSFFYYIFDNMYATTYIAVLLVVLVWFVLNKTVIGLRLVAVGEHPVAAQTVGIRVQKIR